MTKKLDEDGVFKRGATVRVLIALAAAGLVSASECDGADAFKVSDAVVVKARFEDKGEAEHLALAAAELTNAMFRTTGRLAPVFEEGAEPPDAKAAIYIGPASAASAAGITGEGMRNGDWRVKCADGRAFLFGKTAFAATRAVFEFMERTCDYHVLTVAGDDVFTFNPDLAAPVCDRTTRPAIYGRSVYHAMYDGRKYPTTMKYWTRYGRALGLEIPRTIEGRYRVSPQVRNCHSSFGYLPPEKWFAKHPEYYSMGPDGKRHGVENAQSQLCYTNPDTYRLVLESLERFVAADRAACPNDPPLVYDFTQGDNSDFLCLCPECRKVIAKYNRVEGGHKEGGDAGLQLEFVNRLARDIRRKYPDVQVRTFAYVSTERAPKPGSIAVEPNVRIWWCDVYSHSDHTIPLRTRGHFNELQVRELEEWLQLTGNIEVWDYMLSGGAMPEVSADAIKADAAFFAESKIPVLFMESEFRGQPLYELNYYLMSKLYVDPSLDLDELIRTYCRSYGAAAEIMYKSIQRLRRRIVALHAHTANDWHSRVLPWLEDPSTMKEFATGLQTAYDALPPGSAKARVTSALAASWKQLVMVYKKDSSAAAAYADAQEKYRKFAKEAARTALMEPSARANAEASVDEMLELLTLRFKDLPDELRSVPDSDLVCADYHVSYKSQWFDDPASERGRAVFAKDYKKMPVPCGVYDMQSKDAFSFEIKAKDMSSGVYSWVKLGRCHVGRDSLFWFPGSWRSSFRLKDFHVLADGMDTDPNWYELWASAREGDGMFLIDRLVFRRIKANAPAAPDLSATLTKDNVEVVVAANAAPVVKFAAEEMTNFLARVLGAPIPLVNSPTASRASIFLGDSEWSRAAGVDVSSLVRDAFVIKADGDRVYIAGQDDPKADPWYVLDHGNWGPVLFDRATLFGVYEFLERFADVRFYFPGELGTIVPRKTAIEVSGECTVKPDFTSRFLQMWDGEYFEPDPKNRAKTLDYYRLRFETFRVPACHGSRSFMLQRRFGKTHPEYFCLLPNGQRDVFEEQVFDSVQPGQLCWTSGVVEEMYKDAVSYLRGEDASVRGIPAAWAKDGRFGWNGNCAYGKYVDIMPQDGMVPCGCERCRKIIDACRAKGKTEETDLIWGVVSNFAARLTADGLKGSVSMMAYNGYKDVPDFALPSNIEVMTAIYGQWHKQGTKNRADAVAIAKTWAAKLGHPIRMWNYPCKLLGLDVKAKDVPQNCPRAWANFYKEMAPYVNGAFAESETDRWFFNYLNYYVFAKVCWDNDVDVDALLDEHYQLMFGAGAKDMAEIYETLETCWMDGVVGKTVETPMGPVVKRPSDAQMWEEVYSPAKIARMEACVKAALAKVAPGSLEARRIALVDREFLGGLRRRQTDYAKFAAGLKALRLELAVGEEKSLSLVPYSTRLKKQLAAGKKTVRTDVRVRRETDALVVTFDCEEPLMSNVAAQVHEPDYPQLWQENVVEVVIDPIGDFTSYAQIFVNSEGCITDQMWSRIYLPTEGLKWNSGTTVQVTKGEKSWTAVLTIPLKAFPNLPKDFAIEFARERNVTGTADTLPLYHWSPYAYGFSDLENLGRIVFK